MTPALPPEGLEPDADLPGAHPGVPGAPVSRATSLPAVGALLRELSAIIEKAAAYGNMHVPPEHAPLPRDDMTGSFASNMSVSSVELVVGREL